MVAHYPSSWNTLLALFIILECYSNKYTVALSSQGLEPATAGRTPKKFNGGAGVGRLVLDEKIELWQCSYDMVLVERIQGKPKTDSGLFVPQDDLPRLHLCRVISMGPGREEENGQIVAMPTNMKVGDLVIAKNPWGIGPKDEETGDGRKLSFMRGQDIAAVLDGQLLDDYLK